jgi:hypothetical protein
MISKDDLNYMKIEIEACVTTISWTCLRLEGLLLCGSSSGRGPNETGDRLHDTTHITTCVGRCSGEEALTGLQRRLGSLIVPSVEY